MRRSFSLIILSGVVVLAVFGVSKKPGLAAPTDDQPANLWMKKKLDYSQQILAGLATERFDEVQSAAEAMRKLGKIEAFVRRKDTENYRMQLRVFDFANQELIRLAKEENLDGAATAFNQLTLSCLNCHKLLRNNKE